MKDNLVYSEIETKYNASEISVVEFYGACVLSPDFDPKDRTDVSSYDHYYTRGNKAIRYRAGKMPQLTVKEKTTRSNNVHRIETNIDISNHTNKADIDQFCSTLGFEPDFTIFKDSTIVWYEKFNTVYYIVYTDEHRTKELGRFIEIELKEKHPWKSYEEASQYLTDIETSLNKILPGINAKARLKKSLYEMFTQL